MVDRNQDLFVQIDALLGKRSSEALTEKAAEVDDFPMLTDIVHLRGDEELSVTSSVAFPQERRLAERRTLHRTQTEFAEAHAGDLAALEQRLNDLIKTQQAELEAMVRQIIRDELHKILNT